MTVIDIILSTTLVLSFIYGLYLGFISILFPLLSLFITIIIAPNIMRYIIFFDGGLIYKAIIYFIVYIIIRSIFITFEKHIKKLLKSLSLGIVEKILGGISSIIIVSIIIVLSSYIIISFMKKDYNDINSNVLKILFSHLWFITDFISL